MREALERHAAEMRERNIREHGNRSSHPGPRFGRNERIPPTQPLMIDVDLCQLHDEEFRELLLDQKLRWAVAKQVRDLRLNRNWTQGQLAEKAGLSLPVISRVERPNGAFDFSVGSLRCIARAFDVSLSITFVAYSEFIEWIKYLEGTAAFTVQSFDEEYGEQQRPAGEGD